VEFVWTVAKAVRFTEGRVGRVSRRFTEGLPRVYRGGMEV
jgi:hypothetical protein